MQFKEGDKVFLQTVTNYFTGKVKRIEGNFIVLETAAWIASTGQRFYDALKSGNFGEVEPVPFDEWFVNLDSVVSGCIWPHTLPTKQI